MNTAGPHAQGAYPSPPQRLPDWAGDVMAIVVVVLAALFPSVPALFFWPGYQLLVLFVAAVAAALLPLRRRWPIPVLIACALIFGAATLVGVSSLGPGVATAIAAFSVANRVPQRPALLSGGGAAVLAALLSVLIAPPGSVDLRVFGVATAIVVAAALGDSTRSRREYVQAVTERAERAEQTREAEASRRVAEERLRIARDLHDTVAHNISVISLNAGVASSALTDQPDRAREALGTIRSASRGALTEIGELMHYLRTDEDGTAATLPQPGLRELGTLLEEMSAAGLEVDLRVDGDVARITGTTDQVAYRTIQEGLTNARKHGAEGTAGVLLVVTDTQVSITITNPLVPPEASAAQTSGGWGLIGLQERVTAIGGMVYAGPVDGVHHLIAELPLTRKDN